MALSVDIGWWRGLPVVAILGNAFRERALSFQDLFEVRYSMIILRTFRRDCQVGPGNAAA